MRIKVLWKLLKRKVKGSLSTAIEEGMTVGAGVTVMGNVNFGSEPYLISLEDNVRISSDVTFITHDGGTWGFRNFYEDMQDVVKFGPIVVGGGICWRRKHNYAGDSHWKPCCDRSGQCCNEGRAGRDRLGRCSGAANLYASGICRAM